MPSQPQTGRSARVSEHGAALVCPGRSWHVPGNETSHNAFSQNSSSAQSPFWVHVFRSDAGAPAEASAPCPVSLPVTLESAREGCIAESAVSDRAHVDRLRLPRRRPIFFPVQGTFYGRHAHSSRGCRPLGGGRGARPQGG